MIRALLFKELRHHLGTAIVALLLGASFVSMMLAYAITRDQSSLLETAVRSVQFHAPLYAILLARRLFVTERRDGTWDLLAMLPVHPATIVAQKIVLGSAMIAGVLAAYVLAFAALLGRRELIPLEVVGVLVLQAAAYGLGWFAVTTLLAHLGRHRAVGWAVVIIGVLAALDYDALLLRDYTWMGSLWDSLAQTRFAPPWGAVARAFLWAGLAFGATIALVLVNGGLLVQRWFEPMTGPQRASALVTIVAITLVVTLFTVDAKKPASYALLPRVDGVRVAADPGSAIHALATELAAELDALREPLAVDRWPEVVVLRRREADEHRAVVASSSADAIVLRVDPSRPEPMLLRRAIAEVCSARTGGQAFADETQSWIADGFAEAWLRRRGRPTAAFERRVAWAGQAGLRAEDLERWWSVELTLGRDIAEAVAWQGLEIVAARAGEDAMFDLARDVLGGARSATSIAVAWRLRSGGPDAIEARTGMTWEALRVAWAEAVQSRSAAMPKAVGRIERVETTSVAVALAWSTTSTAEQQLWHATMGPLSARPLYTDEVERKRLAGSSGVIPIAAGEKQRVVATIARRLESIDGWVITGWTER